MTIYIYLHWAKLIEFSLLYQHRNRIFLYLCTFFYDKLILLPIFNLAIFMLPLLKNKITFLLDSSVLHISTLYVPVGTVVHCSGAVELLLKMTKKSLKPTKPLDVSWKTDLKIFNFLKTLDFIAVLRIRNSPFRLEHSQLLFVPICSSVSVESNPWPCSCSWTADPIRGAPT